MKLPIALQKMRSDAQDVVVNHKAGYQTLRQCLKKWIDDQLVRPDIKKSTKDYAQRRHDDLVRMLPVDAPVSKLGEYELKKWWSVAAKHYNPQYANNLLSVVRDVVDYQVDAGLRVSNPAREFKRMKIPSRVRDIPSAEQMRSVIHMIRTESKRASVESADLIEWMCYTGMRPAEALRMKWEDVRGDVLIVRFYDEGTKTYEERVLPIMEQLRDQIDRRKRELGALWSLKSPKRALTSACEKLGVPHMTPYACRHFFITRCLESCVDVATIAKWVGHKDGGKLILDTYSHVSDEHGMKMAKKVAL